MHTAARGAASAAGPALCRIVRRRRPLPVSGSTLRSAAARRCFSALSPPPPPPPPPPAIIQTPDDSPAMEDEYGDMDSSGKTFVAEKFRLESGTVMRDVQLRYRTWGTLNEARDNCLVVCHALTGNAALNDWWGSFLGDGLPFDTSKYYVICSNLLGSCYGSTGLPRSTRTRGMPMARISPA